MSISTRCKTDPVCTRANTATIIYINGIGNGISCHIGRTRERFDILPFPIDLLFKPNRHNGYLRMYVICRTTECDIFIACQICACRTKVQICTRLRRFCHCGDNQGQRKNQNTSNTHPFTIHYDSYLQLMHISSLLLRFLLYSPITKHKCFGHTSKLLHAPYFCSHIFLYLRLLYFLLLLTVQKRNKHFPHQNTNILNKQCFQPVHPCSHSAKIS